MSDSRRRGRATWWVAAVVVLLALATGIALHVSRDPGARVVEGAPAAAGWKVVEYQQVRVEIPAGWRRLDQGDCEFDFERWAPPGTTACSLGAGVAFYSSATFDPGQGPGVHRATRRGEPAWGGYAGEGELVVYASHDRRAVVSHVLGSVRSHG